MENLVFKKKKLPDKLIIIGVEWKIVYDNHNAFGCFYFDTATIHINKLLNLNKKLSILYHEVCEIILCTLALQFKKAYEGYICEKDMLFVLNHTELRNFTNELSSVITQINNF
ncbi:MAG: hypothetical protein WC516_05700 [Patescibacteria group bacterium]|jgi:hypothetical protein